jgi:hypothetical protein
MYIKWPHRQSDKVATNVFRIRTAFATCGHGFVVESRDFLFNSRHLSVRAAAFSEGWRIRVFAGDQAATAVVYTVTHENAADASTASMHLVNELMTLAQSDVEEGRVRLIA